MTIPTLQYKGHELRAYIQEKFPLYPNPSAIGLRRYSAVVRIDTMPVGEGHFRRYSMQFKGDNPTTDVDPVELAMQYGKDIIDGKVQADTL